MISPWISVAPLPDWAFAAFRRRAIFDCQKWDPQVGDGCALARAPLVIRHEAWREVVALAEALAVEAAAAEVELIARPTLHKRLGFPRAVRRALAATARHGAPRSIARLVRFDFHYTIDGWRISEANADVPGGLNEASGFPPLTAPHYPGTSAVGDPAKRYVEALIDAVGIGKHIAFVHATAYSDDRQMMACLARAVTDAGGYAHVASPANLRWAGARAVLGLRPGPTPLDAIVRFFPGDWLASLPRRCRWTYFYAAAQTPLSNPATALLIQTKRFPLVWDGLQTPLPTWRRLLPETRDPREVPWRTQRDDWIVKPALGRVGQGVGIGGVVEASELRQIERAAIRHPDEWVAQRRFSVLARDRGSEVFPCLGVYTVDGRVVGAYGRVASRPLIDDRAEDAAVLSAARTDDTGPAN